MKRNVNYTICLLGAMLILCQACQTKHGSSSLAKNLEEDYEATIEYIFLSLSFYDEIEDSILSGIYVHLNVQNTPKYARHLWVGYKKGENVGGYLYMVHHQDTFRLDCTGYMLSTEEVQYTHFLDDWTSDRDLDNPDFKRFQHKLKKHDNHYKEFLAKFFKEAEFYVMADSASFAEYIKKTELYVPTDSAGITKFRKEYGSAIGYPKRKIKVKSKVPFIIGIGTVYEPLEPCYRDYIIIFPDSTIYKRQFETWKTSSGSSTN